MVEKNNWDDNVNLKGTPGDDKLNNWGGSNVTIDGAAGNDTIYISGGTDNKIKKKAAYRPKTFTTAA